jgi:hypothetical protein
LSPYEVKKQELEKALEKASADSLAANEKYAKEKGSLSATEKEAAFKAKKAINAIYDQAKAALEQHVAEKEMAAEKAKAAELQKERELRMGAALPMLEFKEHPLERGIPKQLPVLPADTRAWPKDPQNDVTFVKGLGGSTGAELVRDANGNLYVRKKGNSPEHLREECLSDDAYKALGCNVPDYRLYGKDTATPVKLSRFIEGGQLLSDILKADEKLAADVKAQLRVHFAADALIGNRDVIGEGFDNVLVDKNGRAWRIDNGGGLRYRAQGQLKEGGLSEHPLEFFSMRSTMNRQTNEVFGGVNFYDVIGHADQLLNDQAKLSALRAAMPPKLRPIMDKRVENLRVAVKAGVTLKGDAWKSDYAESFSFHGMNMRAAGVLDRIPETFAHSGGTNITAHGKEWDDLRGKASIVHDLNAYMTKIGGDPALIGSWQSAQGDSSWSSESKAFKYYLTKQRSVKQADDYYWSGGVDTAKREYDRALRDISEATYQRSVQVYHSFIYNFLQRADFEMNDRRAGVVRLVRTEDPSVLRSCGFSPDNPSTKKAISLTRGAAESGSIYQTVVVNGDCLTLQEVPHHRVFGAYFIERLDQPGRGHTPFYGDSENEFVFMGAGLPVYYLGHTASRRSTRSFWEKLFADLGRKL